MGFWDVRLADLEAAGEVFTDEEVRVLEEGGKVLHLHPLQTPDIEVMDWCTYDDGTVVVVPELADIYGPRDVPPRWTDPGNPPGWPSVAHYMDDNFSWRGGRRDWTDIPRDCGEVTHEHYICGVRCEELTGFAYFNCWPVTPENELLVRLIVAGGAPLVDSGLWWQAEWLCRMLYEGEYDIIAPWLIVNHPSRISAEDVEATRAVLEYTYGAHDVDGELKIQAQMFQDLFDARVLDVEHKGLEDLAHGEDYRLLPFRHLEDILEDQGNYEAAALWRRLLVRRRMSLDRIPTTINYRGHAENEVLD